MDAQSDDVGDSSFEFIPTRRLIRILNPLVCPPWQATTSEYFSRAVIKRFIDRQDVAERPWDAGDSPVQDDAHECDPFYHAKRVAYLVVCPSKIPIIAEVGIDGYPDPPYLIWDGNHRFAAALFRKDREIALDFSGQVSRYERMFPTRRSPTLDEIDQVRMERYEHLSRSASFAC